MLNRFCVINSQIRLSIYRFLNRWNYLFIHYRTERFDYSYHLIIAWCSRLYLQVKADSYNMHQQLLLHIEYANKPSRSSDPISLHVAHQNERKKALSRSKSILEKLGRFAGLVNQITVQSLVKVFQKDVTSFHTEVWKVTRAFLTYINDQRNYCCSNNAFFYVLE